MAEDMQPAEVEPTQEDSATEPQTEPQGTDWKAEARKWEGRAKANRERLKELEVKALKYDEYEAAQKTELERANDEAAKAKADANEWREKYEAIEAERERARQVADAATRYAVDADVLARMSGDVEDNARFLQGKDAARPKFASVSDGGEQVAAPMSDADIDAIKNPMERITARAERIRQTRRH